MDGSHVFTWGNLIWNTCLVGALGYLIKRWMDDTRGKIDKHCDTNRNDHDKMDKENKAEHKQFYNKWEDHDARIVRVETHLEIEK